RSASWRGSTGHRKTATGDQNDWGTWVDFAVYAGRHSTVAMSPNELLRNASQQCEAVMNVQTDQDDENKSVKLACEIFQQKTSG
ncbi:hypothetical protein F441_02092, partial [Phytophthora nicotianae CJ01A1]